MRLRTNLDGSSGQSPAGATPDFVVRRRPHDYGQDAMTSAQTMQPNEHRSGHSLVLGLTALLILAIGFGCQNRHQGRLERPSSLLAPYDTPQLWAIAPLANESGTTAVDRMTITDLLSEQLQQVDGVNTIPVNRVLLAMQRLGLNAVTTPQDARNLIVVLGVDGLVVGTITAWDPYQPPKLGLAVQLFTTASMPATNAAFDPNTARRATGETVSNPSTAAPIAQAAGIWDASNHQTLASLKSFTRGRTRLDSAYGPDLYLVDMDLYTQFVAHRLVEKLLRNEHSRLVAAPEP